MNATNDLVQNVAEFHGEGRVRECVLERKEVLYFGAELQIKPPFMLLLRCVHVTQPLTAVCYQHRDSDRVALWFNITVKVLAKVIE